LGADEERSALLSLERSNDERHDNKFDGRFLIQIKSAL